MGLFSRVRQRHPSTVVAPAPIPPDTSPQSKKRGRPRGAKTTSLRPIEVRYENEFSCKSALARLDEVVNEFNSASQLGQIEIGRICNGIVWAVSYDQVANVVW